MNASQALEQTLQVREQNRLARIKEIEDTAARVEFRNKEEALRQIRVAIEDAVNRGDGFVEIPYVMSKTEHEQSYGTIANCVIVTFVGVTDSGRKIEERLVNFDKYSVVFNHHAMIVTWEL